ncbi:DUF5643 domain-containing protein [Sutcliffiella deserti]|uniref:DUF5643 domain-containing protein n=1 Tax=Sutcliffiella deserti TaxID=2875501 RepID=UPI001CBBD967|nr:DUF5643 domain-containing protein [Sutcliffiella deserti]
MGVWIRRIIIIVCLLALVPNLISLATSPFDSVLPDEVKRQIKSGDAKAVKLNEEISFGQDTIHLQQLVFLEDETVLQFKVRKKEQGWSFPDGALKIVDSEGETLTMRGGGSSGTPGGSDNLNYYEKLPWDTNEITISIEWYDRSYEEVISLQKEGN